VVGSPSTIIIGLTGGAGSGKSTAEQLIRARGIPTADADRWVHEILEHDSTVRDQIEAYFQQEYGHTALCTDGRVDRGYIASKAFQESRTLKFLESLIHPRVKDMAERWIGEQRRQGVAAAVVVVPLLLESGMDEQCDIVLVVSVAEEIRIERLEADRGWTREESQERMRHQLDEGERCKRADIVITNEGTTAEMSKALDTVIQNVGSLARKKNRNMNQ